MNMEEVYVWNCRAPFSVVKDRIAKAIRYSALTLRRSAERSLVATLLARHAIALRVSDTEDRK